MLDQLFAFGLEWGLSVNIKKTAVLVFNKSGRLLKESTGFFYGDTRITSEREYFLSGFNILFIRLNGNFAEKAQAESNEKLLFTQENDRLQTAQEKYPFQALRNTYLACRIIWMSSVASRNLVCQIHDRA